jgi:inosine-uridine nucleoside N-ribohydrolase
MKILLDTDIGSDIDDALALAYLLAQPECELLGITTVSGQPEQRARLASAVCTAAGRSVPIFPGIEHPRRAAQRQPVAQQAAALDRWPHQDEFPAGQAIPFLAETIRRWPGEVTLLAIGPLTNVAALIEADPDAPRLLRALTLMGGAYVVPVTEWNIQCDPHAAEAVFRAPFGTARAVGLDVTIQTQLPAAEARRRMAVPALRVAADLAEYFFAHNTQLTFHDPLAAATLFEPALCGFERGSITAVTDGADAGRTLWQPSPDGPHEAALAADVDGFLVHYFSRLAN